MTQQLASNKRQDERPCPRCMREGERRAVEYLPNGGVLFMVAHEDGQICKWAEYASMQSMARPKKKNKGATATYIKCPRCGDQGRLNWAYDVHALKEERPFTFNYIIVHEPITGLWGRKMKRRRRCQSFTPNERIEILKQVGRYIADPPRPSPKRRALLAKEKDEGVEHLGARMREVRAQSNQELIQHKGPLFYPSGKRLTTCTTCNKSGYKYKTYFQHSNEPPLGPRMLRGKQEGWRYRRCSPTKGKVKTDPELKLRANAAPVQEESENSTRDIVKELDKFIEVSSSSLSREDDIGKDYKKLYRDLINRPVSIADELSKLAKLKEQGVITEQEFSQMKSNLMKRMW